MSQVTPTLAARIDRLSRHAHRFHRYAHHPLCGAYANDILRVGRHLVVCRGCAYAAIGGAAGVAAGLVLPSMAPAEGVTLGALAAALGGAAFIFRLPKALGRLAPSMLGSAALIEVLRAGGPGSLVIAAALLAGVGVAVAAYRWRGPNRDACATCPERTGPSPCRGLRLIVRRERAFQRLAQRWIDAGRAVSTPRVRRGATSPPAACPPHPRSSGARI